MTEDYRPPQHVVEEWKKHCKCCPNCSPYPCDGVSACGMCDNLECDCFSDDDEIYGPEHECYMGSDGFCTAAGSEHCDWDCPNGGC